MKKTIFTIATALILVFTLCLVFVHGRMDNNDVVIEFVRPTDEPFPSHPCPPQFDCPEPIPENPIDAGESVLFESDVLDDTLQFSGDYMDEANAWHYVKWIDAEKFYSEYIDFLEQSLLDYENGQLDIVHYIKTLRVYTIVGECLIVNSDNPYVGKIVYETGYHTLGSYHENEFDCEIVQNLIAQLKMYEKNLQDFPLKTF